jgi:transmembrane sensor
MWRRRPENLAAYVAMEDLWRDSAGLAGDADIEAALAGARGRGVAREAGGLGWASVGLGAILVVGLGLCLAPLGFRVGQGQIYEARVGASRVVALADGSRVRLDTDSRIAVRFERARREVVLLQGRAFFDVVHDVGRPFVVAAGENRVTDLGTRFDVRVDGRKARVVLVSGALSVRGAGPAWTLRPGEQVVVGPGVSAAPARADVAAVTSWTTGRLIFRDTPLAEAVREMGRYSDRPLRLDAADLAQVKVNGAFDTGNVDAFVGAISALFPISVARQPDGAIDLMRRPTAG